MSLVVLVCACGLTHDVVSWSRLERRKGTATVVKRVCRCGRANEIPMLHDDACVQIDQAREKANELFWRARLELAAQSVTKAMRGRIDMRAFNVLRFGAKERLQFARGVELGLAGVYRTERPRDRIGRVLVLVAPLDGDTRKAAR